MKTKTIIKEETIYNYAKEHGWFEELNLKRNVIFCITKETTASNMLAATRKVFKNNYVDKENCGDSWRFTIYCGDKETQKWLNAPIRGFATESSNKREMQKYLKEMQKALRETYNI